MKDWPLRSSSREKTKIDNLYGGILQRREARARVVKGEGASQHLMGGVVAYTKEMKIRALGVPAELIRAVLRFVPMSLKPWRAGPADCRGVRRPFPLPVLRDLNLMKMATQSDWSTAVWHVRMRRK